MFEPEGGKIPAITATNDGNTSFFVRRRRQNLITATGKSVAESTKVAATIVIMPFDDLWLPLDHFVDAFELIVGIFLFLPLFTVCV